MTTPPTTIRLDDLGAPRFTLEARGILDALAAHGATVTLGPEELTAAASEQTGLKEWGDDGFRDRLDVLCNALRGEAGLSPVGVALSYETLRQLLCNRLRLEGLIAQHPEIEDIPIERPIIICGLPRTGTTHLHNMLAADPGLRHLPYWESLDPMLSVDEARVSCAAAIEMLDVTMPEFKRMHEMTVDHAHEEIQLIALDLSGMLFETTALLPTWRDHYRSTDQTPSYRYLKRVLQALQHLRGGTRWVLKSPQHLEQFGPLVATFPDATFVVTHRDPVAVTASMCTMLAYSARLYTDAPDPAAIGRYWSTRLGDLLDACRADRHLLPEDQSVDVRFDDFMADEAGTLGRIYELAGQPLDRRALDGMTDFRAAHARNRYGAVHYDLTDFGLDPAERRAALQPYTERFVDAST